jgi:predicted transcriptional regulator
MSEHGHTQVSFSRLAGISQSFLNAVLHGTLRPKMAICDRISDATQGAITASHFQRSEFVTTTLAPQPKE